jgi:carbamoyltransferase
MLVVPQIKPEFHAVIPGVTHVDGTGRVQTVTSSANPYFHSLCHQLVQVRQGPPVLLNTSFNIAGQPIVETPEEAIATFLGTDIDYLSIDNFWIGKAHVPVLNYTAHLTKVGTSILPAGLPSNVPAVTELMLQLDRALFGAKTPTCPWSPSELKQLSAEGAIYKETSRLFPATPGIGQIQTCLAPNIVLLPDPLGKSAIVDLTQKVKPTTYTWQEVQLLLAVRSGQIPDLESLRQRSQLTPHELAINIAWAQQQLDRYQLTQQHSLTIPLTPDHALTTTAAQTFAPFADSSFSARQSLRQLHDCLRQAEYTETNISHLLGVTSQQQLEPTRLHYYDRHSLPDHPLGNLIRLFHLRVSLPVAKLHAIFGEPLFTKLVQLGLFIPRDAQFATQIDPVNEKWSSRVDLFDAAGLYIATDHRYTILPEDRIDEDLVMYLGMDSMGLVYTAPRIAAARVLDLCTGSGVQALTASRYADRVVGIDINPRALRFARFNAQLNGIENVEFCLGNLYTDVEGNFDTILANPPFVPSPSEDYRFRDGGANGEEILAQIISGSADRLTPQGKLFIVTDLVDLPQYQGKLSQWWKGGAAHQLILHTADRDDILFSVPHSHAPFGQTICEYNAELDRWVDNFHEAGLTAVNFGYILIQRVTGDLKSSYYTRTIHNPHRPIYDRAQEYFQQRHLLARTDVGKYYLTIHPDLRFRCEIDPNTGSQQIEIFAPDNLYFTTYPIGNQIYLGLQEILQTRPQCGAYVNPRNRAWIYDLICKGVLVLIPTRPELNPDKPNLPVVSNSFDLASRGIQRVPPADTVVNEELSISELQTKTTPTCLSSYMR